MLDMAKKGGYDVFPIETLGRRYERMSNMPANT